MRACAVQGDPERALQVFQQMRAHHVAPDACTYLALFQAFHRSRLATADSAEDVSGEAEERVVQEQLLRLEADMRASGVRHTVQTQTALVSRGGTQQNSVEKQVAKCCHTRLLSFRDATRGELYYSSV